MCDPVTAIGFGLSAAGQVASFAGQQQATDEYNAAAKQNEINAKQSAARAFDDEGRKYVYNSLKNRQEAYDAVIKARQAKGIVEASAGSAGFDASSGSVLDLVSEQSRDEARDNYNFQVKQDDLKSSYISNTETIRARSDARVASMPQKSGPSPLALGLGIAKSGLDATASSPKGKLWLGIS